MTLPDATHPLDAGDAAAAFEALLDGKVGDEAARDFILTMSLRDETGIEIAAAMLARSEYGETAVAPLTLRK